MSSAILFGSISTVVDTSEIQRDAFNRAFAEHGLDWQWDRERYRELLAHSGGRERIAQYARDRGESVDVDAVYETKSRLFARRLAEGPGPLRPGVLEVVQGAREAGIATALVSSTSPENVRGLLDGVADRLPELDLVVDSARIDAVKPDPAAYRYALERLGVRAPDAVAIEDNLGGLAAARSADIGCVAFPNANTADHDFTGAAERVDELDLGRLRTLLGTG